jgi:hypothetical protein
LTVLTGNPLAQGGERDHPVLALLGRREPPRAAKLVDVGFLAVEELPDLEGCQMAEIIEGLVPSGLSSGGCEAYHPLPHDGLHPFEVAQQGEKGRGLGIRRHALEGGDEICEGCGARAIAKIRHGDPVRTAPLAPVKK